MSVISETGRTDDEWGCVVVARLLDSAVRREDDVHDPEAGRRMHQQQQQLHGEQTASGPHPLCAAAAGVRSLGSACGQPEGGRSRCGVQMRTAAVTISFKAAGCRTEVI